MVLGIESVRAVVRGSCGPMPLSWAGARRQAIGRWNFRWANRFQAEPHPARATDESRTDQPNGARVLGPASGMTICAVATSEMNR
jgi:hypothetical protein